MFDLTIEHSFDILWVTNEHMFVSHLRRTV